MISSPGSYRVHLAPGMASPWSAAKPSTTSPARALPVKAAAIRPAAASALRMAPCSAATSVRLAGLSGRNAGTSTPAGSAGTAPPWS